MLWLASSLSLRLSVPHTSLWRRATAQDPSAARGSGARFHRAADDLRLPLASATRLFARGTTNLESQVAHMAAEMCISPSPAERPSRKRCLEDPTSVVTPPVNPDVAWPAVAQPAARYLPSPDSKRHRPIMLGTVSVRTHGVSGRARDLELTFPSSVIIGHRLKLLVAEAMQTHVGAVRLLCTRTKRLIEDHDEVSSSTSLVVVQQFGGAHPWRSIY